MTRAEAKRAAHGSIAAMMGACIDAGDGDLYVGTEDWTDADLNRYEVALNEIRAFHWRRGGSDES